MNTLFQILYIIDVKSAELQKAEKCLTEMNLSLNHNEDIYELKNRATYFLYGSVVKVEVLNKAPLMEKVIQSCLKHLKNSMLCIDIDDYEDTWGYFLYKSKKIYDQFNVYPFPNLDYDLEHDYYYEGIDIQKMLKKWRGNEHKILEVFPAVSLDSISKYYDSLSNDWEYDEDKVYPEDDYCTGDSRQAFDFIKKLKLPNPITF